jgi:hypothetical protein
MVFYFRTGPHNPLPITKWSGRFPQLFAHTALRVPSDDSFLQRVMLDAGTIRNIRRREQTMKLMR